MPGAPEKHVSTLLYPTMAIAIAIAIAMVTATMFNSLTDREPRDDVARSSGMILPIVVISMAVEYSCFAHTALQSGGRSMILIDVGASR